MLFSQLPRPLLLAIYEYCSHSQLLDIYASGEKNTRTMALQALLTFNKKGSQTVQNFFLEHRRLPLPLVTHSTLFNTLMSVDFPNKVPGLALLHRSSGPAPWFSPEREFIEPNITLMLHSMSKTKVIVGHSGKNVIIGACNSLFSEQQIVAAMEWLCKPDSYHLRNIRHLAESMPKEVLSSLISKIITPYEPTNLHFYLGVFAALKDYVTSSDIQKILNFVLMHLHEAQSNQSLRRALELLKNMHSRLTKDQCISVLAHITCFISGEEPIFQQRLYTQYAQDLSSEYLMRAITRAIDTLGRWQYKADFQEIYCSLKILIKQITNEELIPILPNLLSYLEAHFDDSKPCQLFFDNLSETQRIHMLSSFSKVWGRYFENRTIDQKISILSIFFPYLNHAQKMDALTKLFQDILKPKGRLRYWNDKTTYEHLAQFAVYIINTLSIDEIKLLLQPQVRKIKKPITEYVNKENLKLLSFFGDYLSIDKLWPDIISYLYGIDTIPQELCDLLQAVSKQMEDRHYQDLLNLMKSNFGSVLKSVMLTIPESYFSEVEKKIETHFIYSVRSGLDVLLAYCERISEVKETLIAAMIKSLLALTSENNFKECLSSLCRIITFMTPSQKKQFEHEIGSLRPYYLELLKPPKITRAPFPKEITLRLANYYSNDKLEQLTDLNQVPLKYLIDLFFHTGSRPGPLILNAVQFIIGDLMLRDPETYTLKYTKDYIHALLLEQEELANQEHQTSSSQNQKIRETVMVHVLLVIMQQTTTIDLSLLDPLNQYSPENLVILLTSLTSLLKQTLHIEQATSLFIELIELNQRSASLQAQCLFILLEKGFNQEQLLPILLERIQSTEHSPAQRALALNVLSSWMISLLPNIQPNNLQEQQLTNILCSILPGTRETPTSEWILLQSTAIYCCSLGQNAILNQLSLFIGTQTSRQELNALTRIAQETPIFKIPSQRTLFFNQIFHQPFQNTVSGLSHFNI